MAPYSFTKKNAKQEFSVADYSYNFEFEKQLFYPVCRLPQNGTRVDQKLWDLGGNKHYGTAMYTCTS